MSIRDDSNTIEARAAQWVVRRDRLGVSAELTEELERWLQEDSRHCGALLKAEATWVLLGSAQVSQAALSPILTSLRRPWFGSRHSRKSMLGGLATAVAAGLATVFLLLPGSDHYKTEVGEIRRLALADRSTAAINTSSDVAVLYETERRRIKIEKGEAWFQVAKDQARPFIVEVGTIRVEAVGTAFSVRRRSNGADILVTEGVVKAWVIGAESKAVHVQAGSHAFVGKTATVAKAVARPSQLDRELAWRAGKIDLAGETLAEAVSEFNRYNVQQITVVDQAAAQKRFYGVFRTDDPEGFARAASTSLGVRASMTGDGDIVIASAR